MALSNASVLTGATYAAPTGGSAMAFAGRGIQNSGQVLYESASTDARTQKTFSVSAKDAKPSAAAPNGYTQNRSTVVFRSPLTLDNGNMTVNTIRVELSTDIETTAVEITELLTIAVQAMGDADFTALWQNRSLA